MADQKLLEYLREQFAAGVSETDVRAALSGGTWSDEEINGALGVVKIDQIRQVQPGFSYVSPAPLPASVVASAPPLAPSEAFVPETATAVPVPSGPRPRSLKIFEALMYLSIIVSVVAGSFVLNREINSAQSYTFMYLAMLLAFPLLTLLLTAVVARVRAQWVRVVLVAVLVYSLWNFAPSAFSVLHAKNLSVSLYVIFNAVSVLLQGIALYFLFSSESGRWYAPGTTQAATSVGPTTRSLWNKALPLTNIVFMAIVMALVCGVDLVILVQSPSLYQFWLEMAAGLVIFIAFFWYENLTLSKKFRTTTAKVDGWIYTLIILRNIVFVLNSIPLIQILGGAALLFGCIPYGIFYALALRSRKESMVPA